MKQYLSKVARLGVRDGAAGKVATEAQANVGLWGKIRGELPDVWKTADDAFAKKQKAHRHDGRRAERLPDADQSRGQRAKGRPDVAGRDSWAREGCRAGRGTAHGRRHGGAGPRVATRRSWEGAVARPDLRQRRRRRAHEARIQDAAGVRSIPATRLGLGPRCEAEAARARELGDVGPKRRAGRSSSGPRDPRLLLQHHPRQLRARAQWRRWRGGDGDRSGATRRGRQRDRRHPHEPEATRHQRGAARVAVAAAVRRGRLETPARGHRQRSRPEVDAGPNETSRSARPTASIH
jgi:hypothetical protein